MDQQQARELGLEPATPETQATQETFKILPYVEPERDPSKTGPSPKQLVAVEVFGYEVGRGLRKKVVSPEDVYKLAALGMSNREIARWFDLDHQVINYNFQTIIDKGREDMKTTLRRAMLKNALSGNAALQIFLAKNILGMSDNPTNSDDTKILPWTDSDEDKE
jgi:hypothetical protein